MNKALMIPIRPEHAVNILNGKKTLDLRTWIPKGYVGWVYVYVTKGKPYLTEVCADEYWNTIYQTFNIPHFGDIDLNGKVAFRFWFDEYEDIDYQQTLLNKYSYETLDYQINIQFLDNVEYILNDNILDKLCLTYDEVKNYGKGKELYAWHIKKLEIFDKPKKLSDFYKRIDGLDENGGFILGNLKDGEYVTIPELKNKYLLSKAPRKMVWIYTKEN